jgi:two-component system, LytTR family, response regulator
VKVQALVADDEPLARLRLQGLIRGVAWLECAGESADGESAVRMIDALRPELVFLDVEMPGLSGLEVLERIQHRPAVIFTTAFDRYAVTAFEVSALDYLLKPFGEERFREAVERARRALDLEAPPSTLERARGSLPAGSLSRLFVRHRGRIVPVAVRDIDRLEAQDDYVMIHTAEGRHLVHLPLNELERRLDAARFVRVHRRHLVNIDRLAALVPFGDGRLELELRDGTRVLASRARSRELRQLAARLSLPGEGSAT